MLACGTPDAVDRYRQAKQAKAALRRSWRQKLRVWEEFGEEAMEEDYRTVGLEEILANRPRRRLRRGKQYSANTVYSAGGELLTSTEDIVGRWKKYFEDLLNPTDLPSNLPGKVYARVLERRIRPIVDPWIQEEQCGFRPGRGTVDQLYTLHRVLGGFMGVCPTSPHVLCGSGEGIRPCPSWYSVGSAPRVWGPGAFAKGCSVSVRPEQELGSHCRQRSQGPEGVRFGNHRISSLLFADDVVLLASSSSQDLQHVLERFAAECEAAGMRISTSKSEAMVLDPEKGGVPSPGGWRGPASSGGVQVSRGLVHE
ncbi:hypothetical protein L3Q82_001680 [Scortum barcoo]|uniref:Uncharacterized protein n=1 Tax=Scortum barcoo TaxID=214431 RepID=A0ACB8W3K7_9TELE|nr:hypothetical protein L3Q82_001680 [Scortum barcoo]